ncbi:MAG: ABC transporter ATP-binding protein [Gammaproteobacteria bacterium]|nr:ABC transporter ATP-binding protein [Gammaproteobacteria bacterium]MYD75263.1 ABC transporter ATP-binding protein [Gammaproteobacteria bacterium]MYJ51370.1 ABC transporter ATP-binding protein [Gammaproteobacteria bacterium]
MILTVRDLEVTFRVGPWFNRQPILAVAGVSFDVDAGETFALVGESGSGKTTLAHAINGLQDISRGEMAFMSQRIETSSPGEMKPLRRHMAMMFQDPVGSLSPRMKVGDLVVEPFRIHGIQANLQEEARRLLSLVGLSGDFSDRYPHQLSGGQARRVGVARAIALNPKLIIADEPTAGLDVSVQGEVLNLLNDLRERLGLAMIIITHNLHVVHHVADRMAVMYLGRIVEAGETEEMFRAPAHPYTATLLSANPEPDPDKARNRISLPAEVPSLLARPPGCEFHTRCPWAQARCARETPYTENGRKRHVACHTPLAPGARPPATRSIQ